MESSLLSARPFYGRPLTRLGVRVDWLSTQAWKMMAASCQLGCLVMGHLMATFQGTVKGAPAAANQ